MTFAQRRNRLTTHFSELIPVVKQRISVTPVIHKLCTRREWSPSRSCFFNPREKSLGYAL